MAENTNIRRITNHPKITPQKLAELRALRAKIDAEEKDEIIAMGREHFARHERILAFLADIQKARQAKGMTLDDVAEKTGIGKANLSRLFNDRTANPTMDTALKIADAVGYKLLV